MVVEDYENNWDGQQLVYTVSDFIQANYLNKLEIDGNICSGYVIASRTQGEDTYQAYISCSDYTTEGFEDWRN